jgi:hypothetical protein
LALCFSLSLSLFSLSLSLPFPSKPLLPTCITDATAMGAITYSSAVAEHWALEGGPEGEEENRTVRALSPEQSAETRTRGRLAMFPNAAAAATTFLRLSLSSPRGL